MYNNAINLCNTLLTIYSNQYNNITNKEKEDMDKKYDPSILLITGCSSSVKKKKDEEKIESQPQETNAEKVKLTRQEADDEDLSDMLTLEGDEEEVKEGKWLKTLTPENY